MNQDQDGDGARMQSVVLKSEEVVDRRPLALPLVQLLHRLCYRLLRRTLSDLEVGFDVVW